MTSSGDDQAARVFDARSRALELAVGFVERYSGSTVGDVELLADKWLGYLLSRTAILRVRVSPVTFLSADPGSFRPTTFTHLGGGPAMAVTMKDNEYVTLTADPADAAGAATADSGLTWSADNPALVSLTPSADGTQCNAGALGVGTVNISVVDAAGIASPADPIVITSGPPTSIGIASGDPAVIPPEGVPVPSGAGG